MLCCRATGVNKRVRVPSANREYTLQCMLSKSLFRCGHITWLQALLTILDHLALCKSDDIVPSTGLEPTPTRSSYWYSSQSLLLVVVISVLDVAMAKTIRVAQKKVEYHHAVCEHNLRKLLLTMVSFL